MNIKHFFQEIVHLQILNFRLKFKVRGMRVETQGKQGSKGEAFL